jgi:hypothetical protein
VKVGVFLSWLWSCGGEEVGQLDPSLASWDLATREEESDLPVDYPSASCSCRVRVFL